MPDGELIFTQGDYGAGCRRGAGRARLGGRGATVIDIADPGAVPVTVNLLEPGPGYPVQVHADRLAGLFEAAFELAGPVAETLRAGLRQAYADCGWDLRTGRVGPVRSPRCRPSASSGWPP